MKTVLITGANGFIGKNLVATLKNVPDVEILKYGSENSLAQFQEFAQRADFVFHLAGVNRPGNDSEYDRGNRELTETLLEILKKTGRQTPVLLSSSIQAEIDNPYGVSKKEAELAVFKYGQDTGAKVFVYRFPNVFGKWSKPNYNSVVATFCHNIARGLPITIHDSDTMLKLVYIDDLIDELVNALDGKENRTGNFCEVKVVHTITLGRMADLIYSFNNSRHNCLIPDMSDELTKKLYSAFLSFLPEDNFSNELKMNMDERGSFTEFIKTPERGQVSVNISKPGIVRGNHWHQTKCEKFLVVSGNGVIRFRQVDSDKVIEYYVNGDELKVVDIPVGFTHNIENLGDTDMVTIMWANEPFNPEKTDTYYLEV
jgi:UDP-2-acetamido-2,6-beta-L-arabino-hexul-4-ose reductase